MVFGMMNVLVSIQYLAQDYFLEGERAIFTSLLNQVTPRVNKLSWLNSKTREKLQFSFFSFHPTSIFQTSLACPTFICTSSIVFLHQKLSLVITLSSINGRNKIGYLLIFINFFLSSFFPKNLNAYLQEVSSF